MRGARRRRHGCRGGRPIRNSTAPTTASSPSWAAAVCPRVTAAAGDGYSPAIVTLEDLLAAQIPPVEYFIEQILCVGVTNLSGRPKVGKSWLAAAMALALSTGGTVLGFRARLVCVLYLALEDSAGRLQNRFRKLRAQANRNLHVALGWRAFDDGGLEDIDTAVVRRATRSSLSTPSAVSTAAPTRWTPTR